MCMYIKSAQYVYVCVYQIKLSGYFLKLCTFLLQMSVQYILVFVCVWTCSDIPDIVTSPVCMIYPTYVFMFVCVVDSGFMYVWKHFLLLTTHMYKHTYRPVCHTWFCCRGHGELGPHHLPGDRHTVRSWILLLQWKAMGCCCDITWAGTSGNHGVCPAIDLCAVPDFAIGAMENWGLITYRESALLVDPLAVSSASQKQRVAGIVAHELAHQVIVISYWYVVCTYVVLYVTLLCWWWKRWNTVICVARLFGHYEYTVTFYILHNDYVIIIYYVRIYIRTHVLKVLFYLAKTFAYHIVEFLMKENTDGCAVFWNLMEKMLTDSVFFHMY